MFQNKKSFLYNLRMYLFGQQYTVKERWTHSIAFIFLSGGSGIAIPVIIVNIMGMSLDSKAESFTSDALPLLLYFILYIIVFYPIFYYISKFIVELALFLFRLLKIK